MEEFLLQYSHIFGNPIFFGVTFFLLITTQVLGFMVIPLLLLGGKFIDPLLYFALVIAVGNGAESVNYFVGRRFSPFFQDRFPGALAVMNRHTNFLSILAVRLLGLPLVSHSLGVGGHIDYLRFFWPTFIFFIIQGAMFSFLGQVVPIERLGLCLVAVIACFALPGVVKQFWARWKGEG